MTSSPNSDFLTSMNIKIEETTEPNYNRIPKPFQEEPKKDQITNKSKAENNPNQIEIKQEEEEKPEENKSLVAKYSNIDTDLLFVKIEAIDDTVFSPKELKINKESDKNNFNLILQRDKKNRKIFSIISNPTNQQTNTKSRKSNNVFDSFLNSKKEKIKNPNKKQNNQSKKNNNNNNDDDNNNNNKNQEERKTSELEFIEIPKNLSENKSSKEKSHNNLIKHPFNILTDKKTRHKNEDFDLIIKPIGIIEDGNSLRKQIDIQEIISSKKDLDSSLHSNFDPKKFTLYENEFANEITNKKANIELNLDENFFNDKNLKNYSNKDLNRPESFFDKEKGNCFSNRSSDDNNSDDNSIQNSIEKLFSFLPKEREKLIQLHIHNTNQQMLEGDFENSKSLENKNHCTAEKFFDSDKICSENCFSKNENDILQKEFNNSNLNMHFKNDEAETKLLLYHNDNNNLNEKKDKDSLIVMCSRETNDDNNEQISKISNSDSSKLNKFENEQEQKNEETNKINLSNELIFKNSIQIFSLKDSEESKKDAEQEKHKITFSNNNNSDLNDKSIPEAPVEVELFAKEDAKEENIGTTLEFNKYPSDLLFLAKAADFMFYNIEEQKSKEEQIENKKLTSSPKLIPVSIQHSGNNNNNFNNTENKLNEINYYYHNEETNENNKINNECEKINIQNENLKNIDLSSLSEYQDCDPALVQKDNITYDYLFKVILLKKEDFLTSDKIIALMYISSNSKMVKKNKVMRRLQDFWDLVLKEKKFIKMFKGYGVSTIRKYSVLLGNPILNHSEIMKMILENLDIINHPISSFGGIINSIIDFARNKETKDFRTSCLSKIEVKISKNRFKSNSLDTSFNLNNSIFENNNNNLLSCFEPTQQNLFSDFKLTQNPNLNESCDINLLKRKTKREKDKIEAESNSKSEQKFFDDKNLTKTNSKNKYMNFDALFDLDLEEERKNQHIVCNFNNEQAKLEKINSINDNFKLKRRFTFDELGKPSDNLPKSFDEITNVPYIDTDGKSSKRLIRNFDKKTNNFVFHNSEDEKIKMKLIDDIVKTFSDHFSSLSTEDILEGLKANSFDIWDSFLYLSAPNDFKDMCFDDAEDYIIKNMAEREGYWKIVKEKGFYRVNKRKLFLGPKISYK